MRSFVVFLPLALLAGCVESELGDCNSMLCPDTSTCFRGACVTEAERTQCAASADLSEAGADKVDGESCSTATIAQGECVKGACRQVVCGDGITAKSEFCDDGNTVDDATCSANCRTDFRCGNGLLDRGEACDDGNTNDGDGCQSSATGGCKLPRCGDRVEDKIIGEACDDGNEIENDGCSANCRSNETCGNGIRDLNEQCDLGADNSNEPDKDCRMDCVRQRCGDGIRDDGEICDNGSQNTDEPNPNSNNTPLCRTNCQPSRCGDGTRDVDEVCDVGDNTSGDGCSADCKSDETCGNGIVDATSPTNPEQCDSGIAGLSHDGCSSKCQVEIESWSKIDPAVPPSRGGAFYAWDWSRQVLVVFGGGDRSQPLDDLWEWDGKIWLHKETRQAPNYRASFSAVAYDPSIEKIVLYDGDADETWVYDGSQWQRLAPVTRPPPRHESAMAAAPGGGVVLFGGVAPDGTTLNDTWLFRDGNWSILSIASPPPRRSHSMAFDATNGAVLVGGFATGVELKDTWTLKHNLGTYEWRKLRIPDAPSGELTSSGEVAMLIHYDLNNLQAMTGSTHSLSEAEGWIEQYAGPVPHQAAIAARNSNEIVFFGGRRVPGQGVTNAMSLIDTETQTSRELTSEPAPKGAAAVAYDAKRGVVIMSIAAATGQLEASTQNETWEFRGDTWIKVDANGPSYRRHQSMAYDPLRGSVLLFGGIGYNGAMLNDFWEYRDGSWTILDAGPDARSSAALLYDREVGGMLLVGGVGNSAMTADTWLFWNGTWQATSFDTPPLEFAGAYDYEGKRALLHSGSAGTYVRDGTAWKLIAESPNLTAGCLTYDPVRRGLVLFGGRATSGSSSTTWLFTDQWRPVTVAAKPSARNGCALVSDSIHRRLVLYGGQSTPSNETFVLTATSAATTSERCFEGLDDDGDGLAGCADPDCWSTCTPHCPPQSSSPRCP